MSTTAVIPIFLISFGLFAGFGVVIFLFGSMLSNQPLELKEAVAAALLLAILGAVAATIHLGLFPSKSPPLLIPRFLQYMTIAVSIVVAFLALTCHCSIRTAILMTCGASLAAGGILAILRGSRLI